MVVAAAVTAYLLIGNPFAGSRTLPSGWKKHHETDVAATLAVPAKYRRDGPDRKTDKGHWVTYTDLSGTIQIGLLLDRKSEDALHEIKDSAAAQMYDDNGDFKESGSSELDMARGGKTRPKPTGTYRGRPAAMNTIAYDTEDSQEALPWEVQILYYKTTAEQHVPPHDQLPRRRRLHGPRPRGGEGGDREPGRRHAVSGGVQMRCQWR